MNPFHRLLQVRLPYHFSVLKRSMCHMICLERDLRNLKTKITESCSDKNKETPCVISLASSLVELSSMGVISFTIVIQNNWYTSR